MWNRLVGMGLLEERLLDELWAHAQPQKRALLGLMERLDLLCQRRTTSAVRKRLRRS